MNVFCIVRDYVDRMIPLDQSMKVLLLDNETLRIISLAYTQTQLLERGVFFVAQISSTSRTKMPTMRCIAFVRPTTSSIRALQDELKEGRYSGYTLFFSNALSVEQIDTLAKADIHELVSGVEEYFADYVAINSDFFSIPLPQNQIAVQGMPPESFTRLASGLTAVCLSFRRKPFIRYQKNSGFAKRIALEITSTMRSDAELYDFSARDTLLLILDRAEDPVTPLMTPWTYQALLHELVGLDDNCLALPGQAEKDEFVFSQMDDTFFAANMFSNWGDLCLNVKAYADQCKAALNLDRSTASMEEIKQFMQKLPQTKQLTGAVTKHVNVVVHCSSLIKERGLMDISMLEQDIVSRSDQSEQWARLVEICARPGCRQIDKLRLCLLFNLRYEKSAAGSRVKEILSEPESFEVVKKLRQYYGDRSPDMIFGGSTVFKSVVNWVKGLRDIGNVYSQHDPLLKSVLQQVAQGKLDHEGYPYAVGAAPPPSSTFRPKDVIIFIVGGATFEEACAVHAVNQNLPSSGVVGEMRVLLGGNCLLSTERFINALGKLD